MDWDNYVVKLNVKSKVTDFNHPLNIYETQNSSGTGFFISPKQILTCFHVVSGAVNIEILFKQTNSFNGKIKYIFPDDDLAIVESDTEINESKILNHKVINSRFIGDVYTIGFPLSSTNFKITKGIISGYQESLIQTDAALNHGNSGGPLVIIDESDNTYKVIGINVSKLKGDSEKTGFVVPIYRFIILEKKLSNKIVIKKPILLFEFQPLTQKLLRVNLFKEKIGEFNDKIGIRVTTTNKNYYHSQQIKPGDIILEVNNIPVDYNGFIKFNFYPEKIPIDDLGLWFVEEDQINLKIFNPEKQTTSNVIIHLKIVESNLLSYYFLESEPNYFVENNGLILSVFTEQHFESLKKLNLNIPKLVKILEKRLYHRDLFIVYLADIDYTKINNSVKYPLGEIITEINDEKFNSFDEFIHITKNTIKKIKTNDDEIYFV
jgi:S1-C subfamily serine protease